MSIRSKSSGIVARETSPLLTNGKIKDGKAVKTGPLGFPLLRWARILTSVSSIGEGYGNGCVAGAIVLIEQDMGLSTSEVAIFVAILPIVMVIACPLGGWMGDRYGRLPTLAMSYIMLGLGALVTAAATGFGSLVAGRAIMTLGIGWGLCAGTTYMCEVAPMAVRGQLPTFEELFVIIGVTIGYLFNYLLLGVHDGWRWMIGLSSVLPFLMLGIISTELLPESPRYLVMQGRQPEAEAAIRLFVDEDEAVDIIHSWADESSDILGWIDFLRPAPERRHMIVLGVGCMFLQMLSGVAVIQIYSSRILAAEMGEDAAFRGVLIVGIARIFVIVPVCFAVDVIGRRPLLIASSMGVCIASWFLAFVWDVGMSLDWYLAGLILFVMSYSIGLGPIPYVYASELFDTPMRSKGTALALGVSRLYAGILVMIFPMVVRHFGMVAFFCYLSFVNCIGLVIIHNYAPETRGMSMEVIHKQLYSIENGRAGTAKTKM